MCANRSADPDSFEAYIKLPLKEDKLSNIFKSIDVKKSLDAVLASYKHQYGPRMVTLLRPLMRHPSLRKQVLTKDVLEVLVMLLDELVSLFGWNFGQAMDGLACPAADTRKTIVDKRQVSEFRISRLSRIMEINVSVRTLPVVYTTWKDITL
ncbi:hypothetical protein JVU11DRAFT_10946 [Chiua virens]|nr:hypothetical protein JVU11DRAFT_10946 [Chiua virens]